ncbi:MAG: T9SS type A sorting domain-containing protein [Bacteroidota bacterium]
MKPRKVCIILLLTVITLSVRAQVHLSEGFETGARPADWTEETTFGFEPWRYRNGGHSPNDNNWLVPAGEEDITRNPPSAYEGTYNAIFFKQGDNNERTKLITPELDLLGATSLELSFYLCQIPWNFEGASGWDVLRIFYKTTQEGEWVLLHEYLDPVYDWEEQTLVLPNASSNYYVAFEGHTRWGYGTCIDNILIQETGTQQLYIGDMNFSQPFDNVVPSGSSNIPLLRIDVDVYGNTGSAMLNSVQINSLNTSDNDLLSNGMKLFHTTTQNFSKDMQLGSPVDFVSGEASFTGLNYSLPPGRSYLWVTGDIELGASHGNILDVMVPANGILVNSSQYPSTDQSPSGEIQIYETLYRQDFEGSHAWDLTGEFEVAVPNGMGGSPGNPNPEAAVSGTQILGTDVSGQGVNPYHYEPELTDANSYLATSPVINAYYYKSLNLFFRRHLNIEVWDESSIQVSDDGGSTWNTIWESSSYLSDFQWINEQIYISDQYATSDQLKVRFKLGPTDGFSNYSGWNIDDVFVTGEFISKDVGVSEWIYPQSGSGHTASDSVTVRISNYGGAEIVDPVLVAYSMDGGDTWKADQMNQNIPVGGSVVFTFPSRVDLSQPGYRPSVIAKTALPGDQFADNDELEMDLFIVPTYAPPYMEDFESNDGYWRPFGPSLWEFGSPSGSVINSAFSGNSSWVTGLSESYGDILADKNEIIFSDDFEADLGWTYSGEFERAQPSNLYLPYFAFEGYYCIGTDLSGLGTNPYLYENGINTGSAYTAVSPAIDVSRYSNLIVSFASWIVVQNGDSLKLEASIDNGASWVELWKNTEGGISEVYYQTRDIPVHDSLSYTNELRFRFSLFHTSAVAEGWAIDDFMVKGDLSSEEQGHLVSPCFDLTGLTNPMFEAKLWMDSEEGVDGATLEYSLDEGENWASIANSSGYDSYWNWYTGNPVSALGQNGWSGHSGGWITARHTLPSNLVGEDNVQFRFEFGADKVNNNYDGLAVDDVRILEAPNDLDLIDILDPVSTCELSSSQNFTLRVRNSGNISLEAGDSLQVGYYIERNGDIQTGEETMVLDQSLNAGSFRNITMSTPFDFSISGDYMTNVYLMTEDPHFYKAVSGDTLTRLIEVKKPHVDFGEDISTVRPDTVILRAYSGVSGQSYLWQDSSSDSLFQVSTDGTYYVQVTNGLGCTASDTIQVLQLLADVGVESLVSPVSDCELGDQLPIEVIIRNFGTDTLENGESILISYLINQAGLYEETIVLAERFRPGESMNFVFTQKYDFSAPGAYHMKLFTSLAEDFTAANDTLFHTLETFGYPDSYLGPDTLVQSSEYELSPASGYAEYLWQDGSTAESFLIDEPGTGMYYVFMSDENQCSSSDTVIVTLKVIDLSLEELLAPATSCELSESITVSARIKNTGNMNLASGETIRIAYQIDGATPEEENIILTEDLLTGHSLDFTFTKSETVQAGQWYDFTVFVDYASDSRSWNDSIIQSVGVYETPLLDLGEDFQVITDLEHTLDAGGGFVSYLWQDGSEEQTFTITEPGIGVYSVTVSDANGCSVSDEAEVMLVVPDIGIGMLSHPQTTCHLDSSEHIQVDIKNFGNWDIEPGADISVAYSINGREAVVEPVVLNETFENGAVIEHIFSTTEDFRIAGRYEILVYTLFAPDLIPSNDIVFENVDHYGSPVIDIGEGKDTILTFAPLTLSATPGYPSYLWQDGSTDTDYFIADPSEGMYVVSVSADNECVTVDSVYVAYDQPDIELSRIVSPVSTCDLNPDLKPSLEILNKGFYRIPTTDIITITYRVGDESSVIELIHLESDLQSGQSAVLTFGEGYDFSNLGLYQVQASVIWTPDEDVSNNFLINDVNVWTAPVVEIGGGKDTLISDLPLTLDAGSEFSTYIWQDKSTMSTYEVIASGLYWVEVSDAHGCADRDSVYVASITASRDDLILQEQVRIYPNPADEVLFVALELETEQEVVLELYTISNALVLRKELERIRTTETRIKVQDLTPGTYFLRIILDGRPHNTLVIID